MLGCNPLEVPMTQGETPEVTRLSTLRPIATKTPRINPGTPTPISTAVTSSKATLPATFTITPSLTPTIDPSPTSTIIPVPTISGIERESVFANFMATNGAANFLVGGVLS